MKYSSDWRQEQGCENSTRTAINALVEHLCKEDKVELVEI